MKRGRGRPRVDRSEKQMQTFELSQPLKERLNLLAVQRNKTVSAIIRDILEKFFEDREKI